MRTCSTTRLLFAALLGVCLLLSATAPAVADDGGPPGGGAAPADSSDLNPPPLPAPEIVPEEAPPAPAVPAAEEPAAEEPAAEDDPVPPAPPEAPAVEGKPVEDAAAAPDATPAEVALDDVTVALDDVTNPAPSDITFEPEAPPRRRRLRRMPIHGSFRFNYRLRADGDETDNDFYQYLVLNVGDDHDCGWSGSFHGRLTQDLDGRSDKDEFFVFDSITDTYDHRINGRVYHLYANYRPRGGATRLVRIGRQWIEGGELIHVDGIRADFGDSNSPETGTWGASVFAGLPTHLFEGTPEGDVTFGFSVYGRPWQGGHARLDYTFLNDETNYYGTESAHLITLTLRQQYDRNVSWWASYQHLDEDPRTLRFAGNASLPSQDMFIRGSFFSQLTTQTQTVTELDPYFSIGQRLEPYWSGDVSVSRGVGERLFFEAGLALRQLYDDGDESTFNREYIRYWGAASLDDWPCKGGSVTVTGERWDSADDAWTVTADFEYRPSKRFKLQFGTDYSAYRFDFYTAGERQSVRGYYVRLLMRTSERWRFHLRARLEDDKFDTYFTLNTGFQLEF